MSQSVPEPRSVRCPNCAEWIHADATLCHFCNSGLSLIDYRSCPFCVEMVRKDASYCRFCHSDISIEEDILELELTVRTYNCLKRAGINSVSQLRGLSLEDLMKIKNFNDKSAEEVVARLREFGPTNKHDTSMATRRARLGKDAKEGPEKKSIERAMRSAEIVKAILGSLRHNTLPLNLDFAMGAITKSLDADNCLIWQITGDFLAVTHEFAAGGRSLFIGNSLPARESSTLLLELHSRFPSEAGVGTISVPDISSDTRMHEVYPTLASLMELANVKSRLMVQLRSRRILLGFMEVQKCDQARTWSDDDEHQLEAIGEAISIAIQQPLDLSQIEMAARDMNLIKEIAAVLAEDHGSLNKNAVIKSLNFIAKHTGFANCQIYLHCQKDAHLVPQIEDGHSKLVELSVKGNPIAAVFDTGRPKIINADIDGSIADPVFKHEMALLLPLVSEGKCLGVMGFWQRSANTSPFRLKDRDLALAIARLLASSAQLRELMALL